MDVMNSETLERIKRDMEANRFGEAALTVISLSEGLDLIAQVEWLSDNLQASVELTAIREEQLQGEFKEIERLQAGSRALAALREAAQVVIQRVDDGTTKELHTVISSDPMFAVILSQSEIEALRAALAESEAS